MNEDNANYVARCVARYERFNPVNVVPIRPGWKRYEVRAWDRVVSDGIVFKSVREWVHWLAGYDHYAHVS